MTSKLTKFNQSFERYVNFLENSEPIKRDEFMKAYVVLCLDVSAKATELLNEQSDNLTDRPFIEQCSQLADVVKKTITYQRYYTER